MLNILDAFLSCVINYRSLEIKKITERRRTSMNKFYIAFSLTGKAGVDVVSQCACSR
jgi:hypothetical protein